MQEPLPGYVKPRRCLAITKKRRLNYLQERALIQLAYMGEPGEPELLHRGVRTSEGTKTYEVVMKKGKDVVGFVAHRDFPLYFLPGFTKNECDYVINKMKGRSKEKVKEDTRRLLGIYTCGQFA